MNQMKAILLDCSPHAQFHFGSYSIDDTRLSSTTEIAHAHTLYSAIINIYDSLFDDTNDFVTLLELSSFEISSTCFLLKGEKGNIFFLPKPLVLNTQMKDNTNYKQLKRVAYVSKGVWEKGKDINDYDSTELCLLGDKFLCLNKEIKEIVSKNVKKNNYPKIKFINSTLTTKTMVSTTKETGKLYNLGNLQIQDLSQWGLSAHYYFLLKHELDSQYAQRLELVLDLLPQNGIGGERTSGCGVFDGLCIEDFQIKVTVPSTQFYCNVSPIAPSSKEELDRISYYSTFIRGGRRTGGDNDEDSFKLKQIRMIKEGALVNGAETIGQCVSIKPDSLEDEYLRYGKGFLLPIHENWTKKWEH